ncbi:MAG TPA: glycine--tRNA ligase [Candidatus Paceibacterota bacterium]|nr:glycine--tRNA ligase [Candidatus Paceibacterota bacterium]
MELPTLETIVSLAKRRGFIFPGSEIYGGLAGTWDFGPLGVALKNNIKESWRKKFVLGRDDMYEIDAAILMNSKVWEASGHVAGFSDPMVECKKCKSRFREDQLDSNECPTCGTKEAFAEARQFNMMFKTQAGAVEDSSATVYLRPETAQGMFVNFKNIIDTFHPKLPFGMAQIGKAFRNEITPRDFVFRSREFEQMEIEYFIQETHWEKYFTYWKDEMVEWMQTIGLAMDRVHEITKGADELAHYSKSSTDFEFDFPFGQKELFGISYRTDFDLKQHMQHSTVSLEYSEEGEQKFVPHVIEPTFGVERAVLAVLVSAYCEEELDNGEKRVYLKLPPKIAPVKICVSPLLKNKPELVEKAKLIHGSLKEVFGAVAWDDNGNIGKRYRRQDEIGTPFCVTIDFDTLTDESVTVRNRDTGSQERIALAELHTWFTEKLQ